MGGADARRLPGELKVEAVQQVGVEAAGADAALSLRPSGVADPGIKALARTNFGYR